MTKCMCSSQFQKDRVATHSNLCAFDNALAACVDGVCTPAGCIDPFLDCNGSPEVCETPGDTTLNCGTCGAVCENLDHATTACLDGQCGVDECTDVLTL